MKLKAKIAALFAGLAVLLGGGYTLGSVQQASEYHATTTASMTAGSHVQIQTGQSVLGSIVVASSSDTTFKVWNATSTTDIASTSPTELKASIGENTYTYDINMSRGIILELPSGFDGDYTITWR